jgi:hypothetical protein
MTLNELIPELLKLSRDEKLKAIELLQRDINTNESPIRDGAVYEVWSPYNSEQTAFELLQMIEEDKKQRE